MADSRPASTTCPTLAELGERLDDELGDGARRHGCAAGGAAMDLHDAAAYALHQIDLARRALAAPVSGAVRPA